MCIRKLHKYTINITINITASSTTTMINKTDARKGKHFWRTSNDWLDGGFVDSFKSTFNQASLGCTADTQLFSQANYPCIGPQHSPKHVSSCMHRLPRIPPPYPMARPVFLMMIIKLSLTDASSFFFNHKIQLTMQCMKWNVVVIPPAGCRLALLGCMHTYTTPPPNNNANKWNEQQKDHFDGHSFKHYRFQNIHTHTQTQEDGLSPQLPSSTSQPFTHYHPFYLFVSHTSTSCFVAAHLATPSHSRDFCRCVAFVVIVVRCCIRQNCTPIEADVGLLMTMTTFECNCRHWHLNDDDDDDREEEDGISKLTSSPFGTIVFCTDLNRDFKTRKAVISIFGAEQNIIGKKLNQGGGEGHLTLRHADAC